MIIFDLPPEIFDLIAENVVESGIGTNFQCRQVCRAFNLSIVKLEVKQLARMPLDQILENEHTSTFFMAHGGEVLSLKALEPTKDDIEFAKVIRRNVDIAIEYLAQDQADLQHKDKLRCKYTKALCHAIMAVDEHSLSSKVHLGHKGSSKKYQADLAHTGCIIAAATGDSELLSRLLQSPSDVLARSTWESAIDTAVACGHADILSKILDFFSDYDEVLHRWGNDIIQEITDGLSHGLQVAIRLRKKDEANLIFGFFSADFWYRARVRWSDKVRLINQCIDHGNRELINGAVAFFKGKYDPYSADASDNVLHRLSYSQKTYLLRHGKPGALRGLLEAGIIHPEAFHGHKSLLQHAVMRQSYAMGRVLLENGARIDSIADEESGHTALELALYAANVEHVKVLLDLGAEPDFSYKYSKSRTSHRDPNGWLPEEHHACRKLMNKVKILRTMRSSKTSAP